MLGYLYIITCLVAGFLWNCRTKQTVWLRARWGGAFAASSPEQLASLRHDWLCRREGRLFQTPEGGNWRFEIHGYAPQPVDDLAEHVTRAQSMIEKIHLLGAQPCYFFAEAKLRGEPGDWFGCFAGYLPAMNRRIHRELWKNFSPFFDHTCILRLLSLNYAEAAFQAELAEPGRADLHRKVRALQARDLALLLDDRLYDYCTNHGLIVDLGLLHYAAGAPADVRARVLAVVGRRLCGREDYFISDDGVVLEVSTTYWKLVHLLFNEIAVAFRATGQAVDFAKLRRVEEFWREYTIDRRANRFGDTAGGHELNLAEPKRPGSGVVCRVYDTGLFVADFADEAGKCAQFVLNAQNIHPWVHGQQSQMCLGFFFDDVFWVDSPGRFTSGKGAVKQRVDSFRNQSVPVRVDAGYAPGWTFVNADTSSEAESVFHFELRRGAETLLRRAVRVTARGTFSMRDSAPHGIVESRLLLAPGATAEIHNDRIELALNGKRVTFGFSGAARQEEGLISFERNQAHDTAILCLSGETVELRWECPRPLRPGFATHISPGYPYRKREAIYRQRPNHWLLTLSVKKLAAILLGFIVLETLAVAIVRWGF